MPTQKFFAEHNGETVELTRIYHDGRATKAANFTGSTPDGTRVKAQRVIWYKNFASKHVCDARCINATGRIMKCECSCGGKNHGRGAFACAEA